jgi:peptidoglycan/xylan/chitin deacetylase (PgdA/CDA1 family)
MNSSSFPPGGAVSLTFDDGLDAHLEHAIPILNEHGLHGTFYIHLAAPAFASRVEEWRSAAQRGHEIGNHTIFHPADPRKSWVRAGNSLDGYCLDRMRQELTVANQLLQAVDGETDRTYAYPCSNSILGRRGLVKRLLFNCGFERTRLPALADRWRLDWGSTEQSYVPLVKDLFLAARAGGLDSHSSVPPLRAVDRYLLPSVAVNGWSSDTLTGFTQRGLAVGAWTILQFHGVGGGHHQDCELASFRQYVAWLSQNCRDSIFTVREMARTLWHNAPQPELAI